MASRTSEEWCAYFRANAAWLAEVPWARGAELTIAEVEAIAPSLRGFQLGESSEGKHLIAAAKAHAAASGDAAYVDAIRLFIREEQRHARDLGRLLDLAGIRRLRAGVLDSVFRLARRFAGIELTIAVLITAEIVAQVYYPALRDATRSSVLRAICAQIILDEAEHVAFQGERLARLRAGRGRVTAALTSLAQAALFAATLAVVWPAHGRVFRAGGVGFGSFWRAAWGAFRAAFARRGVAEVLSRAA